MIEVSYSVDLASPLAKDKMGLAIKIGDKVYTFVGDEAEAINTLLTLKDDKWGKEIDKNYRLIAVLVEKLDGFTEVSDDDLKVVSPCLATYDREKKVTRLESQKGSSNA